MQLNLPDKLYYTIGEVANAFGVNTSLIRFWEKEFKEIRPKKNAKGDRRFSKADIETLELIYHLVKERGFTLDGARAHLKEHRSETLTNYEIIRKLEGVKAALLQIKDQL